MVWWKSNSSSNSSPSSSSSSPRNNNNKSTRRDFASIFNRGNNNNSNKASSNQQDQQQPRHVTKTDGGSGSTKTNVSVPLPLPVRKEAVGNGGGGDWTTAADLGGRLGSQIARKSPEHDNAASGRSMFSHYKKALKDPNSIEAEAFRLNIPAKSAPTSGFSSPVPSPPRRPSNVDYAPLSHNFHPGFLPWSAVDFPSKDLMSAQTSPGRVSPEHIASIYSPASKNSGVRSRNPSGPPSPLHPKMHSENSSTWQDGNNNVNVHPLPLPPGATVSNTRKMEPSPWQKQKLIGSGTFGNVYVATNRHTGALCAMKEVNIIPDDPKSAESLKQLQQEIEVLSQLKHPNIVQYYGSEMTEDRFYIYLEYVYPGSINKYVQDHFGAMTESVVRNFTRHILNGLAYLHGSKNIHRDIKGANLLVDINGVVKLADFGMAKHLSEAAGALSLKGTPYWMAPEVVQATMNKDIGYDYAVDIWSLGCTIIEMFTGKHPWVGLEGAAAMFKVLHKDPPIPESLSSEGKDFLRSCFCRNPADRPTAAQLLDHPFVRNSQQHKIHGSLQAFAGLKDNNNIYSPRDRTKAKSDSNLKGKQLPNGANNSSPENSESATNQPFSQSMPEGVPSLFPHSNHPSLSPSRTSSILNGIHHTYALPKPNGKEY